MNTNTYSPGVRLLAERGPDTRPVEALLRLHNAGSLPDELETIEEIHLRADTVTSLLKGILDYEPAPHWGINE